MSKIGVLIEAIENEVKAANFGVIAGARGESGNEIYAFVLNANADACKDDLQEYGVQKIVEVSVEGAADLAFSHSCNRRHNELGELMGRKRFCDNLEGFRGLSQQSSAVHFLRSTSVPYRVSLCSHRHSRVVGEFVTNSFAF